MPLDYKRFNGPEDSVSYKCYTKDYVKNFEDLCNGLVDAEGKRKDGRTMINSRPMFVKTDMVSSAKGSAYIEMNQTKAICTVFDPREIPHQNEFSNLGQLYCEVKFAPFACSGPRRSFAPDAEEKALSVALRQALEPAVCRHKFPNYQVDIFVYILEHGGGCLAASVNVAGLALANAAVPMFNIVTASSVAICGNRIFLDPTEEEEYVALMEKSNLNHGVITLTSLAELQKICDYNQIGSMDVECVTKAADYMFSDCKKLVLIMKQCLLENLNDYFAEKLKVDDEKYLDKKVMDELKNKLSSG